MISSFKLFETVSTDNIPVDIADKLVDGLSITVYKGRKRDSNKTNNYKCIKVNSIDYSSTGEVARGNVRDTETTLKATTSSGCALVGTLHTRRVDGETVTNSMKVDVDGETVYHLDGKHFTVDDLIDKMVELHKKYCVDKSWKVK